MTPPVQRQAVVTAEQQPAVRPKAAATLILCRKGTGGNEAALLMGQRHERHKFMPNLFVFPGGKIDRSDHRIKSVTPLPSLTEQRLSSGATGGRAEALALASVRETFEETGIRLGRQTTDIPRTRSEAWRQFYDGGVVPDLSQIHLVFRAITPPTLPRRFDTCFFMVDADHIVGDPDHFNPSGELEGIHWVPISKAIDLDLPAVTHMVIEEVKEIISEGGPGGGRKVPFYRFKRGGPVTPEYL